MEKSLQSKFEIEPLRSPLQMQLDTSSRASARDLVSRQATRWLLRRLRSGSITVEEGGGRRCFGQLTDDFPVHASVTVHSPHFYSSLAGGSIGAGRSYIEGHWDSDDLVSLVRVFLRNLDVLAALKRTGVNLIRPLKVLRDRFNIHSHERSRDFIKYHYDLGNDFFGLFLDPTMMYSSAIFESESSTLEQAQIAKIERLCGLLELRSSDHLVEIGTGWGTLAIHAAQTYGCRVTTTTISDQQYALAKGCVDAAGLSGQVEVVKQDYRTLSGSFDKLVSVEMIEAIGWQQLNTFFHKCSSLLKPDGLMALQAITIADNAYENYKVSDDYIKRFIFPGSCLTSVASMMNSVAKVTDMRLDDLKTITAHYARTLNCWRKNMYRNLSKIKELGYDTKFLRMWEFYLACCEAGFRERRIGDVQMLFAKPAAW